MLTFDDEQLMMEWFEANVSKDYGIRYIYNDETDYEIVVFNEYNDIDSRYEVVVYEDASCTLDCIE